MTKLKKLEEPIGLTTKENKNFVFLEGKEITRKFPFIKTRNFRISKRTGVESVLTRTGWKPIGKLRKELIDVLL